MWRLGRGLDKPARIPVEQVKIRYADKDNKWLNKNSVQKFTYELESSSSSEESSTESDETFSGLSDILTDIFADTDNSEEEFEGFLEEDTPENADFKVLQTNKGVQDDRVKHCCLDADEKQNRKYLRLRSDESQSDSSGNDSDGSSIRSDESMSGLSEILNNIFADTDDSEEEFECFLHEGVPESTELHQTSNDMQDQRKSIYCVDGDKKQNVKSLQLISDESQSLSSKDSDESSIENDENQSGLSEILSIFADSDGTDEEFDKFKDGDMEEVQVAQDSGTPVNGSTQENYFVIIPPASNEICNDLFSDYSPDEKMKKIKKTIVEDCILKTLISSDVETKEGLKDADMEDMQVAQEDCGSTVKGSSEENNFVMIPSASNEVCDDLFSDYSSDEETKKIKKTIVEYEHILDSLISSDDETEEGLMKKKPKCNSILEENPYNVKILKDKRDVP